MRERRRALTILALLAILLAACRRTPEHRSPDTLTIGARGDDYVTRAERSQLLAGLGRMYALRNDVARFVPIPGN